MPVGLRGTVIAALLAAAMSSLSSGFNSLTTVLTVDFFNRNVPETAPQPALVMDRRRAQVMTLVIGVLALAIAYPLKFAQDTFIGLSSRLMEPLTGPLFGLFALAFFDRRASGSSAGIGFAFGVVVAYFIAFGHVLLARETPFSFLWILPMSIVATILAGIIASRLFPRPQKA
jgi:SSS family solute:Na+ symporter